MKSFIANATFAVFVVAAGAAQAETPNTRQQVMVSYADLDPSQRAGARALLERIDAAAIKVCGGTPDNRDLRDLMLFHACTREAMSDAVASLNQPMVSQLYGTPATRLASER